MADLRPMLVLLVSLLASSPAAAQSGDQPAANEPGLQPPLSEVFDAQPGTARRLSPDSIQLTYMYTAPNTCWLPGTAQAVAIEDGMLVVLLTPEIVDKICAMRMTALDYTPIFAAPPQVETIFVQVMHPMGGHIETSEILIEAPE